MGAARRLLYRMADTRPHRAARLMTRRELASQAGVNESTIRRIEHGHAFVTAGTLRCIATALHLDPLLLVIQGGEASLDQGAPHA